MILNQLVPHWLPDDIEPTPPQPPDGSILWAGDTLYAGVYSLPDNTNGVSATLKFMMSFDNGEPDEASASYPNFNASEYIGWLNTDPNDNEYWMRVNFVGTPLHESRYQISDGDNDRALNEVFQMKGKSINPLFGPYISVHTFGDAPPIIRIGVFNIEICKDDGNGLPDGNWASRHVSLEAIFSTDNPVDPDPIPPPPIPDQGTPWDEFFYKPFALDNHYDVTRSIPDEGVFLRFTVPAASKPYLVLFYTVGVTSITTTRTAAVNVTAGDFVTPPTEVFGFGVISGSIAGATGTEIELIPGNTYFWNIKNTNPDGANQIRLLADIFEER